MSSFFFHHRRLLSAISPKEEKKKKKEKEKIKLLFFLLSLNNISHLLFSSSFFSSSFFRPHYSLSPTIHHTHTTSSSPPTQRYTPISNPARATGTFDLAIKHYKDGAMSQIFAALNVGDTLEMCGPFGDVTVEESEESSVTVTCCGEVVLPSTRVVHMIAAGSGITPMLQLLNAMISSFSSTSLPEVTLVYANKKYSDICFRTHLQALQSKWPTKFEVRSDTVVGCCWLLVVCCCL